MATVGGQASLIGHSLGGYDVQALIGRGAMGTVYLAQDKALNRDVALKVLLGSLARTPDVVHRFHLEAQAAAPLRHPNIVQIYSAGIDQGTPFIAMEYVEGEPLDRFLRRQGRVSWQTALYVGQQVGEALDCAHHHGVIHRDVKPSNVLLDSQGKARLTDFGIADVAARGRQLPDHAAYIGTLHYMSPEQCAGREVGAATDLYSLGVMLYFMIAGRLPFDAESPVALIKSITNDEAPRLNRVLAEVPDDVARLVAHLMAKNPKERPPDAAAVVKTVKRLQAEKGGRSAMPEALASFMREHTRIRPVRSLIRPGIGVEGQAAPGKWKILNISLRALLVRLATAAVCLAVCISLPVLAARFNEASPPVIRSYALDLIRFRDLSPQVRLAEFSSPGFVFHSLCWIGQSQAVLVRVIGREGSLNHGASGLLALDVQDRESVSVQTPAGPTTEPYFWSVRAPSYGSLAPPCSAPGFPLDGAVLVQGYGRGPRRETSYVEIRAQDWHDPLQKRLVGRVPADTWNPRIYSAWPAKTNGFAVPKPDGVTFCLVLNDPEDGSNYLVERDVRWLDLDRLGARLTTAGNFILSSSVRYSPSGRQVAYIRFTKDGRRELMVFVFGRDHVNGRPVALGVAGEEVAFSPDESLLAVAIEREGGDPELRLISSANGMVIANLGYGMLTAQPWHPSGTFLVATHQGTLWAIGVNPPHHRVALTSSRLHVKKGAAISRNGTWIAAILEEEEQHAAMVFVRLDQVTFADLL